MRNLSRYPEELKQLDQIRGCHGYFLDRFLRHKTFFGFDVHCGLRIFRYLAFGSRFSRRLFFWRIFSTVLRFLIGPNGPLSKKHRFSGALFVRLMGKYNYKQTKRRSGRQNDMIKQTGHKNEQKRKLCFVSHNTICCMCPYLGKLKPLSPSGISLI